MAATKSYGANRKAPEPQPSGIYVAKHTAGDWTYPRLDSSKAPAILREHRDAVLGPDHWHSTVMGITVKTDGPSYAVHIDVENKQWVLAAHHPAADEDTNLHLWQPVSRVGQVIARLSLDADDPAIVEFVQKAFDLSGTKRRGA